MSTNSSEQIVTLHGLARTGDIMLPMVEFLAGQGFAVINPTYPSTQHPIEVLAEDYLHRVVQLPAIKKAQNLHFVVHSMGGIILRYYLQHHSLPNLRSIVMVGTPNRGAELVDWLKSCWWVRWYYRKFFGPAGQQIGCGADSLPKQLPIPNVPTGMLAGNRSGNWLLSRQIPGENDGKVSVCSTALTGMGDQIVLPLDHCELISHPTAMHEIVHFIRHQRFTHANQ